jgi:carbamoyl-phosphate synthase small subunit
VNTPGNFSDTAVLVLEDGTVARGRAYGAQGTTFGEIVFNTGMTGYQETLTDPSYHKQIVIMTAPHIGNTGVNDEDPESAKIWVAGWVVRDRARRASNWRAQRTLDEELANQGIVGICEVDTRFLTRHLRDKGVMNAGIFSGPGLIDESGREKPEHILVAEVRQAPQMRGSDLAPEVSTKQAYTIEPLRQPIGEIADRVRNDTPVATVVGVDLGIKSMTPQRLAERGVRMHVVPVTTTADEILALLPTTGPRGVFFSNGPGDPSASDAQVDLIQKLLDAGIPFFGICYGNQLLGRALGFPTYKLAFGHRGLNQPVKDLYTGKVEITAHNHGFAVDAPVTGISTAPVGRYGRVVVSHVGLNDGVVEGLACLDIPAFSVQYHPEAAAGPHDSAYLFDRFIEMMQSGKPLPPPPDSRGFETLRSSTDGKAQDSRGFETLRSSTDGKAHSDVIEGEAK